MATIPHPEPHGQDSPDPETNRAFVAHVNESIRKDIDRLARRFCINETCES
jgi:hypothetical protein